MLQLVESSKVALCARHEMERDHAGVVQECLGRLGFRVSQTREHIHPTPSVSMWLHRGFEG